MNRGFNRKITCKCSIFHCHVWLPEGMCWGYQHGHAHRHDPNEINLQPTPKRRKRGTQVSPWSSRLGYSNESLCSRRCAFFGCTDAMILGCAAGSISMPNSTSFIGQDILLVRSCKYDHLSPYHMFTGINHCWSILLDLWVGSNFGKSLILCNDSDICDQWMDENIASNSIKRTMT